MPAAGTTKRVAKKRTAKKAPAKKSTRRPAAKKSTRKLSASHKTALAEGRTMSASVDRYVQAVNTPKRRGRKVTRAALEKKLSERRAEAKVEIGVQKVLALQEVRDLEIRIAQLVGDANGTKLKTLEAEFIKVVGKFSASRNISYGAWRDAGVPADVLKKGGIARTRES